MKGWKKYLLGFPLLFGAMTINANPGTLEELTTKTEETKKEFEINFSLSPMDNLEINNRTFNNTSNGEVGIAHTSTYMRILNIPFLTQEAKQETVSIISENYKEIGLNPNSLRNLELMIEAFKRPEHFMVFATDSIETNIDAIQRTSLLMNQLEIDAYNSSIGPTYNLSQIIENLPAILNGDLTSYKYVCLEIAQAGKTYLQESSKISNLNLDSDVIACKLDKDPHAILIIRDKDNGEVYLGNYGDLIKSSSINPADTLSLYYANQKNPIYFQMNYEKVAGKYIKTTTNEVAKKLSRPPILTNKNELKIILDPHKQSLDFYKNNFALEFGHTNIKEFGYNNSLYNANFTLFPIDKLGFKLSILPIKNSNFDKYITNIVLSTSYQQNFKITKNITNKNILSTQQQFSKFFISNFDSSLVYDNIKTSLILGTHLNNKLDNSYEITAKRYLPLSPTKIYATAQYINDNFSTKLNTSVELMDLDPYKYNFGISSQVKISPDISISGSINYSKIQKNYNSLYPKELNLEGTIGIGLGKKHILEIIGNYNSQTWCKNFTEKESTVSIGIDTKSFQK